MEARFEAFLDKHKHSEMANTQVAADRDEIEKYRRFKDYFCYGFYVAEKMAAS